MAHWTRSDAGAEARVPAAVQVTTLATEFAHVTGFGIVAVLGTCHHVDIHIRSARPSPGRIVLTA